MNLTTWDFGSWDHTLSTDVADWGGGPTIGTGTWGGSVASMVAGFNGGLAIRNPTALTFTFSVSGTYDAIIARVRFRPTAIGTARLIIGLNNGAVAQDELWINASGKLEFRYGGNSSEVDVTSTGAALSINNWYDIEIGVVVNDTNGSWLVKRDGVIEPGMQAFGVDTRGHSSNNFVTRLDWNNPEGDFDDWYLRVGTSTIDNDDYLTDPEGNPDIITLWPNSQGNYAQWVNTTGVGQHYEEINEVQMDNSTSYLSATSALGENARDSWFFDSLPEGIEGILKLKVIFALARIQQTDFRHFIRANGSDYDGPQYNFEGGVFPNFQASPYIWETNPDTGDPWTIDDVNNIEVGIQKLLAINSIRISQAVVTVLTTSAPVIESGESDDQSGEEGEGNAPDYNISISSSKSFILLDFIYGSTAWKLTNATTNLDTKFGRYISDTKITVKLPANSIAGFQDQAAEIEISHDLWPFASLLTSKRSFPPVTVHVREREHGLNIDRMTLRYVGSILKAIKNPARKIGIVKLVCGDAKKDLASSAGISENPFCAWVFGDLKTCDIDGNIDLASLGESATLVFTSNSSPIVTITGLSAHPNNYWRRGFVRYNGLDIRIRNWSSGETFQLSKLPPLDWDGATVEVFPGCDKRSATCEFWNNIDNFRGLAIKSPSYHPVFENPSNS